jgi:rubrerythrin
MYSTETILETVLLLHPRLEELLGAEIGQQVNTQLLQLLSQIQAEAPVENQLIELLAQHEPTRREMRELLDRQTESDRTTKGPSFQPLPGKSNPQPKPQFQCPQCGYTWSRLKLGKPTPLCPEHHIPLKFIAPT